MQPWGIIGEKLLSGDHVASARLNGRKGLISRSGYSLWLGEGYGIIHGISEG